MSKRIVSGLAMIALAVPGQDTSRIREHLFQLTDVSGPRNVGSPGLERARTWLEQRLREYGLESIRREQNQPIGIAEGVTWDPIGWSASRLTVQQLAPWQATLIGVPVLYSPATRSAQAGEVVVAPLPPPDEARVAEFIRKHRATLKDKFLLDRDTERLVQMKNEPVVHRYSDREMLDFESLPPVAATPKPSPQTPVTSKPPSFEQSLVLQSRLYQFLKDEGVLGIIGAARGEAGVLSLRPPPAPPGLTQTAPPPMFDLTPEHFNRLLRLVQHGIPVRLEVDLRSEVHGSGTVNLLADLPGSDKADEIVIAGAHLDSWHGATGATDNATGVAVLLEAARLLKASNIKPRRTIRFAFWDGEEFGMAGSRSYVNQHLRDTDTKAKISSYFNYDYGAGRIRGVYLQGRVEAQKLVQAWLDKVPGQKLVASPRTTLGSDQASFERAGIPGFSFIQDPLNYESRTHHTTMDFPEYVSIEDLQYSAETMRRLLLEAANAEDLVPRASNRK